MRAEANRGRPHPRGERPQGGLTGPLALAALALAAHPVAADPIPATPLDVPARSGPPVVAPGAFRAASDLDGFYVWAGPLGAATTVAGAWDSQFGGDLAALRVREGAALGLAGGDLGFTKYTAHSGGRLWLDGVAGTRVSGRMMAGLTVGPVLEISDVQHTRVGASVGAWAFVGLTPYVRVGALAESGAFVELGVRIALPVFRR